MGRAPGEPRTNLFRPRHRLRHRLEFDAVYAARMVAKQGPLTIFGLPTARPEARLGLSVGRRVGNAIARNAAKRRIREAFRVSRSAFERADAALDIVVVVLPHEPLEGDAYRRLLEFAATRIWKQVDRQRRDTPPNPSPTPREEP